MMLVAFVGKSYNFVLVFFPKNNSARYVVIVFILLYTLIPIIII